MKLTKSYRVTIWTGPPQHHYFSGTCCLWPGHCTNLAIFSWIWFLFTCLAWENSRHLVTLPLVSPQNNLWETSEEIPYWWRVATQIWVVTRQQFISALVSQTSFGGKTSGGVAKCRLFSQAITCLVIWILQLFRCISGLSLVVAIVPDWRLYCLVFLLVLYPFLLHQADHQWDGLHLPVLWLYSYHGSNILFIYW